MSIDSSSYVRNKDRVLKHLKANADGSLTVTGELKLHVPYRFIDKGLLEIKDRVRVLGCYALIAEDKYFCSDDVTTLFETAPTEINDIIVDDEAYVEMVYTPGDKFLVSTSMLKDNDLVYVVGSEITGNGKIPWYFSKWDLVNINPNYEFYNGLGLHTDLAIYEMLASLMMRNPKNLETPYRVGMKSIMDFKTNPPTIVGINKVDVVVSGTLAKLGGPYLSPSITGALNSESTNLSNMEYLMRV